MALTSKPWSILAKWVLSIPPLVATVYLGTFLLFRNDDTLMILVDLLFEFQIWIEISFAIQLVILIVRVWQFDNIKNSLRWYWMILFIFLYLPSSLFYIWSKDDELVELDQIKDD
jgi:hypothetical protein